VEAAPVPAIRLDGRWKGRVTYDWGPSFDETFTLRLVGGTVTGSAGFLGQGRTILEGFLEGSSLRFVTKRIVTAGSDQREVAENAWKVAMIRAVSADPMAPVIRALDAEGAIALVRHCADHTMIEVERNLADNPVEANHKRVCACILTLYVLMN
jgi:hypothetical protein